MIPRLPSYIFVNDQSLKRVQLNNIVRSEMEVGPQKTRPIQSSPMFNVKMDISICDDKLSSFRQWFNNELRWGANWFIMKDPFDGTERRFRFLEYSFEWSKVGDVLQTNITLEAYDEL